MTVSTYNESPRPQAEMFPVIAQPAFRYSPLSKDTICAGFQCLGRTSAAQPWLYSLGFSGLSDQRKQLWAGWGWARPQLTLKLPPTSYKYCFLLGMLWEELSVKKQHFPGLQLCWSPNIKCQETCNIVPWASLEGGLCHFKRFCPSAGLW